MRLGFLWNQIKSDVLKIPYVRLNREELSVLGLAIIDGYAIGAYKSMVKTSKKITKPTVIVWPRSEVSKLYEKYAKLYLKLMGDLEDDFETLQN